MATEKKMIVLGVFDEVRDAEHAIAALKTMGVTPEDIAILAHPEAIPTERGYETTFESLEPKTGVVTATAGMVATLVGIGLCAVPLFGLLTAGPLVLAGGVASVTETGRPMDDLRELGVPFEDAQLAFENVRRGGIAVAARVERLLVRRVSEAMARANAVDFRKRGIEWENEGWVFEPNAPPWTSAQIAEARAPRLEMQRPYQEPPIITEERLSADW